MKILYELGIKDLIHVLVFCDNDSTIKLTLNPVFQERIKHFENGLYFVREIFSNGVLKMVKISSSDQNANILTKSLIVKQHNILSNKIGLANIFGVDEN